MGRDSDQRGIISCNPFPALDTGGHFYQHIYLAEFYWNYRIKCYIQRFVFEKQKPIDTDNNAHAV